MRITLLAPLLSITLSMGGCAAGKPAKEPRSSTGSAHAEVGKAAPDLSIQSLDGKRHISLSELSGKVVIVDFWATWCKPCRKSFPNLEEVAKTNADKVEVIAISVDDTKDGIAAFVKETGVTFPIAWDEGHAIADRWGMGTMPTTFVIDPSGVVRYRHDGFRDDEPAKIAKELKELEPAMAVAHAERVEAKPESAESPPQAAPERETKKKRGGKKAGKPRKKRA
jgi:cytochrome c biogenesis protein CcmG, thiol:disulfide interchange protein DsbE